MSQVPITLGKNVVSRQYSWMQMVIEEWGDEWAQWDVAYNFHGSEKLSTDSTNRGIYGGGAK